MINMKQYYDTIYDQREETLKQRKQFEIFRELDKLEDTSAQQVFAQDLANIMLNAQAEMLGKQCAAVKETTNITKVNRKSVVGSTKDWCCFAKSDDEIEVCEWGNGEGFDVNIQRNGVDIKFPMTWGEWEMMKHLVEEL